MHCVSTSNLRTTARLERLMILVLALLTIAGISACASAEQPLSIGVLSSRSDMVSGGTALVEVKLPPGLPSRAVDLRVNGAPAMGSPPTVSDGNRWQMLITGLQLGANEVTAAVAGQPRTARITLVNHPRSGPIFSGERNQPFECRTVESGLGAPIDDQCSVNTRFDWFYFTADRTAKPLPDPLGPRPADLDQATTLDGRKLPFIVRVESGTINRSIYRIAVLDDPRRAGVWNRAGWNGRVIFHFGGATGVQYNQGTNRVTDLIEPDAADGQAVRALEQGFATIISSLNIHRVNVDDVLSAETAMMIREHVTKTYGLPRWMAGLGASGGAIQQLLIAQNYPGILDGIMPDAAFPDVFTTALAVTDCRLLNRYFTTHDARDDVRQAVEGHLPGTCGRWDRSYADAIVATSGAVSPPCGLNETSLVYHPATNPMGTRCTIYDKHVKTLGTDPATGFARRPLDNVGVQYGLRALHRGELTPAQFLHLNESIGGFDIDGNPSAQRTMGDPHALRRSYAYGRIVSGAGGLATVPILHMREYDEPRGDIHTIYNDIKLREQLVRANGQAHNQVIWVLPDPALAILLGLGAEREAALTRLQRDTLLARLGLMTHWLDAIVSDPAPLSPAKVARLRPADAIDSCWDLSDDSRHREPASFDGSGTCNTLYPKTPSPRMAAGAPVTDDVIKCQLKPVALADYAPAVFTPQEHARLNKIFPTGVCDYSRPGVGQIPLQSTWRRY